MFETHTPDYYYAKFSPIYPKYLSILWDSDLQVVEHDNDDYKLLYVNRLGSRYDTIRCTEWSTDPSNPLTLAAGFKNGRVALFSYTDENGYQNADKIVSGSIVKEFVYKNLRQYKKKCNALSWNTKNPSLLAAGYDWTERMNKSNQYSIVIWDVNKEAKAQESSFPIYAPYADDANFKKDYFPTDQNFEKGVTKRNKIQVIKEYKHTLSKKDDSTALVWYNSENSKILSGTHKGSIKLLDLIGSSQTEIKAHNKRVISIKLSPFNSNIIASCCEDQAKIFDMRNLRYPVIQINHDIKDIEFSNYHSYVLATIHNKRNSKTVKFWNINSCLKEELNENDSSCLDLKYPFALQKWEKDISYITWVPRKTDTEAEDENKYLVVGDAGTLLHNHRYKIINSMPISFSAWNELAFTNENKTFFYNFMSQNLDKMNDEVESHKNGAVVSQEIYPPDTNLDDISDLICKRINHGYGLDIDRNVEISKNFSSKGINTVWRWLKTVNDSNKPNKKKNQYFTDTNSYYKGINYLFEMENNSEEIKENPELPDEYQEFIDTTIYNDQERLIACKLWGWTDFLQTHSTKLLKSEIKTIVDKIEREDPVRATCVAACHFDFATAVIKLSSSKQEEKYDEEPSNLSLMRSIFMMFNEIHSKNFTPGIGKEENFYKQLKDKIWKDGYKMRNEYFNWILTLFNNPKGIIKGFKQIDFMDKIASICRFFSKDLLKQTLAQYIDQGIKEGNIETLILTGFEDRCHEVLQSYVDFYGDFQTPALIACFYMKYVGKKDPRVTKWIMEYRKYLSKIRLWNVRWDFDISRMTLIEKFKDDPNNIEELSNQFKKYEHTIFCPLPMWETNIGVAHNTEEEKHSIAVIGTSAPRGIHRSARNPAITFSKHVPYCKCTNQLNCSVCSLPMNRVNPMFKSHLLNNPNEKGFKKSRSESSAFNRSLKNTGGKEEDLRLEFSEWFSWCNTWKHIGHLEHLEEWFSHHTEWAIPDCHWQWKLQCPI